MISSLTGEALEPIEIKTKNVTYSIVPSNGMFKIKTSKGLLPNEVSGHFTSSQLAERSLMNYLRDHDREIIN